MLLCVLLFYCLDHLCYCFIVWTICPFILIECHTWHCSILLALESVLSGNLSALLSSLCFICTLCCYIPTCFLRACLEALAGEHSTPLTGDWPSSVGTVVLWPSGSCRRDTWDGEGAGDMHLPSQISWVNPATTGWQVLQPDHPHGLKMSLKTSESFKNPGSRPVL